MSDCGCAKSPCECNILSGLRDCIDGVLSVRDCIGAVKHPVYILTRTWGGEQPGEGNFEEEIQQILPSPGIKDYSHDLRIKEGGSIRQGDIILKNISKKSYPNESEIDCSTSGRNIEKYYLINGRYYVVIHIKEDYLTWDVHLRKRSIEVANG